MPIRVLDANGVGTVWGLTQAMAYAIDPDQDPRTADGASIINLSMSMGRHTTILKKLLRVAEAKNVVVVAAAGNTGTSKPEYPAAEKVPNKLAVAASTPMGALADFSTYGRWVDVAAPGTDVLSSVPGGDTAHGTGHPWRPARLRDSCPAQGEQPHAGGDCSHSRDASGYRESRC
jgi:thermitase